MTREIDALYAACPVLSEEASEFEMLATTDRDPEEWCTSYHCAGDCGLRGHGYQHQHMKYKTAAQTPAERKAAERKRRNEAGLKRLELWAHPGDHEDIKSYARAKMHAREMIAKANGAKP